MRYNTAGKVSVEPKCYSSRELAIADAKHYANYAIRSTAAYQLKERDYLNLMYKIEAVTLDDLRDPNQEIAKQHTLNLEVLDKIKTELAVLRDDIESYDSPGDATAQRLLGSSYDKEHKSPIFIATTNIQRYPSSETYAVYNLSGC